MRLFITLMIGLLLWAGETLAQDDLPNLANQASAAYMAGDPTTAISLYESLIVAGVRDSTIYFNLGTAHYTVQNFGQAVLNFRRAQLLTPRDPDLTTNLARVRAQRLDIQGDETALVDTLAALTASLFTLNEVGWIVLVVWLIFFVLIIASLLRPRLRDGLRIPLVIFGIVVLAALMLFGSRLYINSARPAAVAVAEVVTVMSGPGEDYLPIDELHSGAEMRLLELRGEWLRFVLPDGRQGWAQAEAIAQV